MIRKTLGFLFVAGSVALIACSSDDASSKYPSTDSFCAALANAECTDANAAGVNVEASCPVADTTCQTTRKAACETAVSTATAEGRAYDSSNVDACLAATKTATVTPTVKANLDAQAMACAQVFAGTKGKSETCTTEYDCQATLVCDLSKNPTSGVCADKVDKALNDPCTDPGDTCAANLFCDGSGTTYFCHPARAIGQACTPTIPCDTTTAYCNSPTSGVCTALGAAAAPCTANEQCTTNFCNTTKGLCQARSYASTNGDCKDYGGTD